MTHKTFNITFMCLLGIFITTDALAYPRHSDPSDVFLASLIVSAVLLLVSVGFEKIIGFFLKLCNISAWKAARTDNSIKSKNKTHKKISLKAKLTWVICYEIITILILSDYDGICETFFSYDFCRYDGFQYIIMCIFVPAIVVVISMWKEEIKKFLKIIWQVISK